MAESAVSFLVDQLAGWIRSESELLGGIQENAERIRYEMGQMRAFLRVADEKEEIDLLLKEWVKQVRDVPYDAEDVMDEFMIRFAGQQDDTFCGFIKRIVISVKNLKVRRELALEIGAILSRLITISEGQQRYKDIYGSTRGQDSRSALGRGDALLLEDAEVVGIEKPEKQLIEWISSIDSGLKVISVVGTAGSGKSTLVRKVSADPKVKMRFDVHVWLTVSESFKLEELLRNLIRGLVREVKAETPEGLESMNPDEMKEFVYKFLNHKTYIIVLDDVWKLNVWEAIRYMFPRSGSYGSIMITTRFHNIGHAASVQTKGYFYNIHPLPLEESKKLFYNMAFMGSSSCSNHLEEVAEIILKRCEGLPLAIVVIGRLLATKNNIEEWNKFQRSLGAELEGDQLWRITKLISLSYYDLPYYLKSCYMYLSIFPEDHFIPYTKLILMWIAEGFVQPKEGQTLEEVGEDYIKELVDRSLIQVAETDGDGKTSKLRVHDLC